MVLIKGVQGGQCTASSSISTVGVENYSGQVKITEFCYQRCFFLALNLIVCERLIRYRRVVVRLRVSYSQGGFGIGIVGELRAV